MSPARWAGLATRLPSVWRGLALVLLNVLVLLALVEFACGVVLARLPRPRYAGSGHLAWYDAQPWIRDYRAEFPRVNTRYRFAPFVIWEGAPFSGRAINVDADGRRVTPGARCDAGAFTVWVFGGSTVWGVGSADSGTIPARLQAALAARTARPVCVVNEGERAYVSSQELLRLERALRGAPPPDVAVFYHGSNDVNIAARYGRADQFQNADLVGQRVYERSAAAAWLRTWRVARLVRALRERRAGLDTIPGFRRRGVPSDSLAVAVAVVYHANRRFAQALGSGLGFAVVDALQPMIAVGHKPFTAEEQGAADAMPAAMREFFRASFAAIRSRAGGSILDLTDVFDGEPGSLYIDWFHVSPVGNAVVARRLADTVAALPSFRARARAGSARP